MKYIYIYIYIYVYVYGINVYRCISIYRHVTIFSVGLQRKHKMISWCFFFFLIGMISWCFSKQNDHRPYNTAFSLLTISSGYQSFYHYFLKLAVYLCKILQSKLLIVKGINCNGIVDEIPL